MKTTQKKTNNPDGKLVYLTCICGASAKNTSKEARRFRRRHPANATEDHAYGAAIRQDIFKARERLMALPVGSAMVETLRDAIKDYQRELNNLVEVA